MEYLLWQVETKDIAQEFKQGVAAFQRRTGRPPVLILVRAMDTAAVPPAGVNCVESPDVAPLNFWVTGDK